MAEYYQIMEKSLPAFLPLFTKEAADELRADPDILAVGAVEEETAHRVYRI